jgi:superfamily II helicase
MLKHEMDQLETWLSYREDMLKEGKLGNSIGEVEDLLRKHEDFEQTVAALEDRFNGINRKTLVRYESCSSLFSRVAQGQTIWAIGSPLACILARF